MAITNIHLTVLIPGDVTDTPLRMGWLVVLLTLKLFPSMPGLLFLFSPHWILPNAFLHPSRESCHFSPFTILMYNITSTVFFKGFKFSRADWDLQRPSWKYSTYPPPAPQTAPSPCSTPRMTPGEADNPPLRHHRDAASEVYLGAQSWCCHLWASRRV